MNLPVTQDLDSKQRQTGRTTQIVTNAVERALRMNEPSVIIIRASSQEPFIRDIARTVAGELYRESLIECVSLGCMHPIAVPVRQIFRDHAAH